MQITLENYQQYLAQRYGDWANEQGLFMKLVEEMGEVAEVLNQRSGRKAAEDADLQLQLGTELVDMLHYVVAIAAVNRIDLNGILIEKDRKASLKYHHEVNLEKFLSQTQQRCE